MTKLKNAYIQYHYIVIYSTSEKIFFWLIPEMKLWKQISWFGTSIQYIIISNTHIDNTKKHKNERIPYFIIKNSNNLCCLSFLKKWQDMITIHMQWNHIWWSTLEWKDLYRKKNKKNDYNYFLYQAIWIFWVFLYQYYILMKITFY